MGKLISHDDVTTRILDRFKKDIRICISLLVVVPLGFSTKFYSGYGQKWVRDSLGGVFYEIFWCLVVYLFCRKLRIGVIAAMVLLGTCCLEFLQLWHPFFLEYLRSSFIGRTILGTSFAWSDFPYYFIGCVIGWLWLHKVSYPGKRHVVSSLRVLSEGAARSSPFQISKVYQKRSDRSVLEKAQRCHP
jgi:hypothetical protein